MFANINDLPSASDVASRQKMYKKFKETVRKYEAELLDHRPHQDHGPPLDTLCEAFAQFSDDVLHCVPREEAGRLVGKLVDLASKVDNEAYLSICSIKKYLHSKCPNSKILDCSRYWKMKSESSSSHY